MKALTNTLKVFLMIFSSIWGMFLGCAVMLVIIFNSDIADLRAYFPDYIFWYIFWNSLVFYVIPTFLVMLEKRKTASVLSIIGFINTLVIYGIMRGVDERLGIDGGFPEMVYMPSIAITIIILLLTFILDMPVMISKKREREKEKAPSILDTPISKRRK